MLFQGGNINVDEILAADSTAKASAQATIDSVANAYRQGGFDDALKVVLDIVLQFGWTLRKAVVVFYIGRWIIRKLRKIMERSFERRNVDSSLRTFLGNLVGISLNIMLIIMIFSILGIHTTSFVALLASAGLAIGMALSGTLQNFAGGVMILLLKPYRVGDYIEAQGLALIHI